MNPISKLSDDHRAVLFDLWGMIEDLNVQNPAVDSRSIDWSVDTYHLGIVEKSNLLYDLTQRGILKFDNKLFIFPKSTLNNINKFLFE
jgi:hypothetical protein